MIYTIKPSEIYQQKDAERLVKELLIKESLILVDFRPVQIGEFYITSGLEIERYSKPRRWGFVRFIVKYKYEQKSFFE